MSKPFTTMAVLVLALVALLHLARVLAGWEVVVDGAQVPLWPSWIAVVVAGGLAVMVWRENRA
jgi:hypothetical protein